MENYLNEKSEPDGSFDFSLDWSFFQGGHPDGRNSSFHAFIAMFAASALQRLLFIIGRYQAENMRFAGGQAQIGQSNGYCLIDIRIVTGFAPNHTAQANHRVHVVLSVQDARTSGQFKRAGHLYRKNIFWFRAVL